MISFFAFLIAVIGGIFWCFNQHILFSGSASPVAFVLLFISIGLLFAYIGPVWVYASRFGHRPPAA